MLAIMTSAETNRIPRFPDDPTEAGIRARREYVERRVEGGAPHLFGEAVDPLTSRGNVENVVGYAQVPVGIAGPLVVHGESGTREVVYPLATNEGAMVAAYSRGMSVLNRAGGVRARVVKDGLTQHPMLEYTGVDGALAAAGAIEALMPRFHELVAARTDHGRLLSAEPEVVGRRVILRLTFATGDAIGINMAANASDAIAELVEAQTSARTPGRSPVGGAAASSPKRRCPARSSRNVCGSAWRISCGSVAPTTWASRGSARRTIWCRSRTGSRPPSSPAVKTWPT